MHQNLKQFNHWHIATIDALHHPMKPCFTHNIVKEKIMQEWDDSSCIKCLQCEHSDPCMIPSMFLKKLGMMVCTFNPSPQEVETGRCLGLSDQQVYANQWVAGSLKHLIQRGQGQREIHGINLWHACSHMCHTHLNMYTQHTHTHYHI